MHTRKIPPRRDRFEDEAVDEKISTIDDDKKNKLMMLAHNMVTFESLLNGHEITDEMALTWRLLYPFSIYDAKKIVEVSSRVPKQICKDYLFPGVDFEPDETDFFEILSDFGKAHGIVLVTAPLFEGAIQGDPRAVKMYLDLLRVLDPDASEEEEAALRKLMRVQINLD